MSTILSRITTGSKDLPPRVNLSGVPGVGKTTFATHAPGVVFACAEDGLGPEHRDIPRFVCTSFQEVLDLVTALRREDHSFKWLVFDTADWLERLLSEHLLKRDRKQSIEDYGYGKGYTLLSEEFTRFLAELDLLRREKKIGLVFLSHVEVRTFQDPAGVSWDRYQPKGSKQVVALLKEWVDAHLFAVFEVFQVKDNKRRAIGGERVMHSIWSPAWDAKNRLGLPEKMPLEWSVFEAAETAGRSEPALAERAAALFATAEFPSPESRAAAVKKFGEKPTKDTFVKESLDSLRKLVGRLEQLQPSN